MLRKLVCGSLASAFGTALVVLVIMAFAPATTAWAPMAGAVAAAVSTDVGAPSTLPDPHIPQGALGSRPAFGPREALDLAPADGIGLAVNYAHDWVCSGGAEPGTQVQITVKRGGDVLAAVSGPAGLDGLYCSHQLNNWVPARPDIRVGDSVFAAAGDATAKVDPVGEVAGNLDVTTSTVSGVLHVPALAPSALTVVCEVWPERPGVSSISLPNVAANGGTYVCDFGEQSFQVTPGDDIAVHYNEPDGDQVFNVFRAPAPNVSVDVWSEGGQVAASHGLAVFHIRYQNNGSAPAADVIVTDNLPANVTFVPGNAPVVPVVTGSQVAWHLGDLAPGAAGHFFVVLANTLEPGDSLENTVTIGTSSPGDNPGDNQRSVSVPVVSGTPDVWVDQWAHPGDVLPGDSYRLDLGYGNNNPLPAGPVQLHLQLPAGTTLLGWASQNGFDQLWTLTPSTDNHLIFEAPALPAGFGDQLLVRARVAPALGNDVQLASTAWIEAPGDANAGNNGPIPRQVRTSSQQRPDLSVNKQWGYGVLVPGGPAWYQINYSNDGNLTQSSVRLTDTLPSGTRFVEATVDSNWNFSQPLPPVYQAGNVVAWDLGQLAPAEQGHFKVKLALDGVAAGATITNTASIAGLDHDRSWWNNHSEAIEQVNGDGANLRIRQRSYWDWPGQLRFELQFENTGTTIVNNVRITDTVPAGLNFNENWWRQWWGDLAYTYDPSTRQIVWTISRLEPTWAGGVNVRFDVPQADIGHQGLTYTNEAEITLPAGDVSPADNSATELAFSGPDLFVHHSVWSGKLLPGALVTFKVDFGNLNNGPWSTGQPQQGAQGVAINDTLPAGMTFVSATNPWSPGGSWTPQLDGNKLVWTMNGLCSNCRFQFLVTARIDDTVRPGTDLTGIVEIHDLVPEDVDPFLSNNASSWSGRVRGMTHLPSLRR